MDPVTINPLVIAGVLATFFVANAGLILGAYVSMRVSIATLKVYVDILQRDVDALGGKIRTLKPLEEEK